VVSLDPFIHILAWSVAAAGLLLVAWALLWDRSRGRRRCPNCWYDLSATAGLHCSECGHEARHERQLFRTRRQWNWAAIGVVIMLAAWTTGSWQPVKRDGWAAAFPNFVLQPSLSLFSQQADALPRLSRVGSGWTRWQRLIVAASVRDKLR
jgi:hypothetical protein